MVMGYRRHALKEGPMRLGLLGALLLAGCNPLDPTGDVFTLYRNSGVDKNMRVHVASFDVANGGGIQRRELSHRGRFVSGAGGWDGALLVKKGRSRK